MTYLNALGIEASYFYCWNIKISAIMSITVFPRTNLYKFKPLSHNTTICCRAKVTFRVTQFGGYVIVDVGGNYVTFHALNVRINIKNIYNNSSLCELWPPVF